MTSPSQVSPLEFHIFACRLPFPNFLSFFLSPFFPLSSSKFTPRHRPPLDENRVVIASMSCSIAVLSVHRRLYAVVAGREDSLSKGGCLFGGVRRSEVSHHSSPHTYLQGTAAVHVRGPKLLLKRICSVVPPHFRA